METFVTFQLYGPMASWGDIAVGELRTSQLQPTRSALLGLVGAALGIRREEDEALRRLGASLAFAVCVEAPGAPLRDYHTIQHPQKTGDERPFSRARELDADVYPQGTMQTWRDYRVDALYSVAMWIKPESAWSAEELVERLNAPRFPLYMGRRACVLALPLAPQLIEAEDAGAALEGRVAPGTGGDKPLESLKMLTEQLRGLCDKKSRLWFWEEGIPMALKSKSVAQRRDEPGCRQRWQFQWRLEHQAIQTLQGG